MGGSSTSSTTIEPFSGQRNDQFNQFIGQLQSNLQNPAQYTGNVTTPTNAATTQGISGLTNAANNQTLQDYANGKYLDPSTNPYMQQYANELKQNSQDQYGANAQAIDSRFSNRGFYDGSSHVSALTNAANQSNENYDNALTNLYNTNYQQNVGNMLSAQGQVQNANTALTNAGNTSWNQSNTNNQNQLQEWLTNQGVGQQDISNLINAFNVGKDPTATTTSSSNPGFGGIFGSILGNVLGGGFGGSSSSSGTGYTPYTSQNYIWNNMS